MLSLDRIAQMLRDLNRKLRCGVRLWSGKAQPSAGTDEVIVWNDTSTKTLKIVAAPEGVQMALTSAGSTPPGGAPGSIQYNDAGAFGGYALLPIAKGGTNAATAADARTNLATVCTSGNENISGIKTFDTELDINTGAFLKFVTDAYAEWNRVYAGDLTQFQMQVGSHGTLSLIVGPSHADTFSNFQVGATGAPITLILIGDIKCDTVTGNKIGTATTEKIGFWNATPVAKTAVTDQAAWADVASGADHVDLADLNTKVKAIRDKLQTLLDQLQTIGLV